MYATKKLAQENNELRKKLDHEQRRYENLLKKFQSFQKENKRYTAEQEKAMMVSIHKLDAVQQYYNNQKKQSQDNDQQIMDIVNKLQDLNQKLEKVGKPIPKSMPLSYTSDHPLHKQLMTEFSFERFAKPNTYEMEPNMINPHVPSMDLL